MARSNIKAVFENDVQTVWNVITDVENRKYGSDNVLTDSFWIMQLAMKKVECTCIYMLLTY